MIPVFILSSERSGSNLLRRILGTHSSVSAPPPINLFNTLTESLLYSGPLNQPENIRSIIEDAIKRSKVKDSHLSWNLPIDINDIYPELETGEIAEIVYRFYKYYSNREMKKLCVIKEHNLYKYMDNIVKYNTNAKFLYLVRDGRDVICSNKKIKSRKRHVYAMAHQWKYEQINCIKEYNECSAKGNIALLRYEKLLENPYKEIKRICDFLGIGFEKEMLGFYRHNKSKTEASQTEFWENLDQPLMQNNKGKFLNELTKQQLHIVETIAGEVLELLGYPLVSRKQFKIGLVNRIKYQLLDKIYLNIYNKDIYADSSIKNLRNERRKISKHRRKHRKVIMNKLKYFDEI
jgi:hypothetical protein